MTKYGLTLDAISQLVSNNEYKYLTKEEFQLIPIKDFFNLDQNQCKKLISSRFLNFSFQQLYDYDNQQIFNLIDKSTMSQQLIDLIQIIKDSDKYYDLMVYCFEPKENILKKSIIDKMPEVIKIIYLINYTKQIAPDLKPMFKSSIGFIFKNPNLFCPSIFQEIIYDFKKQIMQIPFSSFDDINNFPKSFLYDFLTNSSQEIIDNVIMKFNINDIVEIQDNFERFFVFKFFVNYYLKHNNFAQIQQIPVNSLSQQETLFLIDNCLDLLSGDQFKNIVLNYLKEDRLLHLMQEKSEFLIKEQIYSLDINESMNLEILIKTNNLSKISEEQIKSINFLILEQKSIETLVSFLYEHKFIPLLNSNQIHQIHFHLLNIEFKEELISDVSDRMSEKQIQNIDFSLFKKQENITKIFVNLLKQNFIKHLQLIQIKQINIFHFQDINIVKSILSIPNFHEYIINNTLCISQDLSFQRTNFDTIDNGYLKTIINLMLENISDDLLNQINFDILENKIAEIVLKMKFKSISNKQIRQIKTKYLKSNLLNRLIEKKHDILTQNQVQNTPISELNCNSQIILLQNNKDDFLPSQIPGFDTTNITILKLLLKDHFDFITSDQINLIDFNQLDIDEQIKVLNKENKFYDDLDKRIINDININQIKKADYATYCNLVKSKSKLFSNEQLMTIDFLDDSTMLNQIYLNQVAKIFINRLIEAPYRENVERFIFDKNSTLQKEFRSYLQANQIPNEILVSILNSRIIHGIPPINSDDIKYLMQTITIFFDSPDDFLIPIEFIINNWTKHAKDLISKFIDNLKIATFSKETTTTILENYLFDISSDFIKSLNLSEVQINLIKNSFLNRPLDFSTNQFSNMDLPDSFQKEIFLQLLRTKNLHEFCSSINLTSDQLQNLELDKIEIEYLNELFICKPDIFSIDLVQNKIKSDLLNKVNKKALLEFLNVHVNNLTKKQIRSIEIEDVDIVVKLLLNRIKDLKPEQIDIILNEFDEESIDAYIRHANPKENLIDLFRKNKRFKYIPTEKFTLLVNINSEENFLEMLEENIQDIISDDKKRRIIPQIKKAFISNLSEDLQVRFIESFSNEITNRQWKFFDTKMIKIVRMIIENDLLDRLSEDQIKSIDLNKLDQDELLKLLIDSPYLLQNSQINLKCVTEILKSRSLLKPNELSQIVHHYINDFTKEQIQVLDITIPKVSANLMINRAIDLSKEQIQQLDFSPTSNMNYKIFKLTSTHSKQGIDFILQFHLLKNLSDVQFNTNINYENTKFIEGILFEGLESKISDTNAQKIKINEIINEINKDNFQNLFNACCYKFNNTQYSNLDTSNKIIAQLIIQNSLFHKLNSNQKNNFNKDVLMECDENALIFCATCPCKIKIDEIITGILIYKYFKKTKNSIEMNTIIQNFIYEYNSDIFLAKFLLIIEDEYKTSKNIKFSDVSKNFFGKFRNNVINKLKNNIKIEFKFKSIINITPDDLLNIIWEYLNSIDIQEVKKLLNNENLFQQLPKEYKSLLSRLAIGRDKDENKEKIFLLSLK